MEENIPMSEKAKGKQRAYPLNPPKPHQSKGEPPSSTSQSKINLIIRFVDGAPDLELQCNATDTGSMVIKEVSPTTRVLVCLLRNPRNRYERDAQISVTDIYD
jgi:hypothetical protein